MAKVSQLLNSLDSSSKEYDFFIQGLLSASSDVPLEAEEVRIILSLSNYSYNFKSNFD